MNERMNDSKNDKKPVLTFLLHCLTGALDLHGECWAQMTLGCSLITTTTREAMVVVEPSLLTGLEGLKWMNDSKQVFKVLKFE